MQLLGKYILIYFKSQMQYQTSFWLLVAGQFFVPFSVFAGLIFLFERFGGLQGWSFHEVALCFGIIHMAYALGEFIGRGFDTFSTLVVSGDFDRLLVRPRSTELQVLGSRVEFSRLGRLLQSTIVLAWAVSGLQIDWTPGKIALALFMIAGGTCIFFGIFMLAATLSFWTVEGLEVSHVFTDGGREMAQYPLGIYHRNIARFFTLVIPFGCVNYWPLLYLLDRTGGQALPYALAPAAGLLFIVPCVLVWRIGVRHYRSTGS